MPNLRSSVDPVIESLRGRQEELHNSSQAILDTAESENQRDLTVEESQRIDELSAEFERVGAEIARRERINAHRDMLEHPQGRRTEPDAVEEDDNPAPAARVTNAGARQPAPLPGRAATNYPQPRQPQSNWGFKTFGHFALAVKSANPRFGGELDNRLIRNAAATTYSSEGVGADGGFAIPPDFRAEIMGKVFSETNLVSRTDQLRSSGNSITMPVDNTTPWQTSGGVQAYWVGEAATKGQSKIALEQTTVKLNQLAALIPITEELLEDAPALDGYLRKKVPEKMDFTISDALAWGNGAGKPLGWMSSPCLVTQAAEGAQTADTINATNAVKMLSRMPLSSRSTAVWLIHPDAEPQLPLMTIGNQPVYLPGGNLAGAPFGTLLGRPIIPHQICKTVGDLGDFMLVDLQQYMSVLKIGGNRDASGMRTDVSIHLWFDQDMVAYRFTLRIGGQPWWTTPTASKNGSLTQSPFVVLAAR